MHSLIQTEYDYLAQHFPFAPEQLDNVVALDIETTGLSYFDSKILLVGIVGFVDKKPVAEYYQFGENDSTAASSLITTLQKYLESGVRLTGHNLKFDLKFLVYNGILTMSEALTLAKHDSNIQASVITNKVPERYVEKYEYERMRRNKTRKHKFRRAGGGSLKVLAPYKLGIEPFWESDEGYNDVKYCLLDCLYTYYLTAVLKLELESINATKCYEDLVERMHILLQAEFEGITLDVEETKKRLEATETRLQELRTQIKTQWSAQFAQWEEQCRSELEARYKQMCASFVADRPKLNYETTWSNKYRPLMEKALEKADFELNVDSPAQLEWLLKTALGRDITGIDGEETTDKGVLAVLAETYEDMLPLIEYKKYKKLQSTYYPNLLEFAKNDGRIHCSFNLTGTKTGRLSSSEPNLQNQPGAIHDLFVAKEGNVLITKDLGAIEPVMIAYFSECPNLCDIILNGKSFHSVNAKEVFALDCEPEEVAKKYPKERKAAKEFGLSVLYGAGPNRVQQSLKKYGYTFGLDDCRMMVKRIRDYYKDVWSFKEQVDHMGKSGEILYNYFGRPVLIKELDDIYMSLFNSLIQGSASDLLIDSGTKLVKEHPWIRPRLFVHDEIVIEVPEERAEEAEQLLTAQMTSYKLNTKWGNIPITVEGQVSKTWQK